MLPGQAVAEEPEGGGVPVVVVDGLLEQLPAPADAQVLEQLRPRRRRQGRHLDDRGATVAVGEQVADGDPGGGQAEAVGRVVGDPLPQQGRDPPVEEAPLVRAAGGRLEGVQLVEYQERPPPAGEVGEPPPTLLGGAGRRVGVPEPA